MKNEAAWLELYERPIFNDKDDARYNEAWKWVQELQAGGRLTSVDVFALQCLIDALATPPSVPAQQGEGCDLPPGGWLCTRDKGHEGPCAAYRPDRWAGVIPLVEKIMEDEGATVTFTGPNPDFNGLPNECVVVCGPTTNWQDMGFRADTLVDCLRAATPPAQDQTNEVTHG